MKRIIVVSPSYYCVLWSEVENWLKKHEANELESASHGATPTDFYLDQTIVAGLEDLVNTVNLFQSATQMGSTYFCRFSVT